MQIAGIFAGGWMVSTAMGAHLPRLLVDLGPTPAKAAWTAGLMAASAVAARLFDLVVLHRSHPMLTVRIASLFHPLGAMLAVVGGARLAPLLAVGQGVGNDLLAVASGVLPLHVFGPARLGTLCVRRWCSCQRVIFRLWPLPLMPWLSRRRRSWH